jgi:hypothetical protein
LSSYSGGAVRYATAAGASASYTFTGRAVALVTTRAPSRGSVKVYVNGVYIATVNLATTTTFRSVAWQRSWSTVATRTVTFVVVGTANHPRIDLDAIAILG